MIRELKESDVSPLTEIYNYYVRTSTATFETEQLTEAQMHQRLFAPLHRYPCLVIEEESRVLGYGALHPWRPRFDMVAEATMYLAPEILHKGYGSRMLAMLIERGRQIEGLNGIIACINANNSASKALLAAAGFRHAGRYENVAEKFGQSLTDEDYQLNFRKE